MKNFNTSAIMLLISVYITLFTFTNSKTLKYKSHNYNATVTDIHGILNSKPHGDVLRQVITDKYLDDIRHMSKFSPSWTCFGCEAGVLTLQSLLRMGIRHNTIAAITATFCQILHIQAADVCAGIIDGVKDELLDVLDNMTLPRSVICYYLTGEPCYPDFNETLEWNVTLPDVPKPPVQPPEPPKKGSPELRVLHLSDIHVDMKYKPGSNAYCGKPLCCHDGTPRGEPAGKWGDYRNCDTPTWTVENLFQHLSKDKFDHILWTGDLYSHEVWNVSKSEQIKLLDYLTSLFLQYFPHTPVYPSLGNHEGDPLNSFPPPFVTGPDSTAWLYDQLYTRWQHWLSSETNTTITRGGYYTVVLNNGLRIVSLNFNYCHRGNWWLMLNSSDPTGQLQWLIEILQAAENKKEKVHIVGHIAPGMPECLKTWSWNYYRIINRYESTVTGQFFGHAHSDFWQMFYDESKRPIATAYLGPSVTPYSYLNPAYRVYSIDGSYKDSSYMVLDHETYIMNLTEANRVNNVTWFKEYSAKEAYGLKSLLPSEWDRVTRDLMHNDQLFSLYYRHYYKSNMPQDVCDKNCREYMICQLMSGRSHDPEICRLTTDDLLSAAYMRYHGFVEWKKQYGSFC